MSRFMDENFLLYNNTAIELFHKHAKDMPIIDYHCHLNPKDIYEDRKFRNIADAWLYGDHYKWRVMRAYGVDEKYITGDGSDYDKFLAWAKTVSMAIGNPLFHWTHLELQRYFGIFDVLSEKTASEIWEKANKVLNNEDFSAKGLIEKSNVKLVCTTDDPVDSLEYHMKLKEDKGFKVKVLPAFRPDKAIAIDKEGFTDYISKLEESCGKKFNCYAELLDGLRQRALYFHNTGCRVSDHALDYVPYMESSEEEINEIFLKALAGQRVSKTEEAKYRTRTLQFLGEVYSELGWTMQFHMNCVRNNNSRMFDKIGPDTGYDCMNDANVAVPLSKLLDSLEKENNLPKTILYSLNGKDNYTLASLMGCFQGGGTKGKMQLGSAWWFLDHKNGMEDQLKTLASVGMLSTFVGMLTDSRSFLSYTRHEYFRRILCNLIGQWVEDGEYPYDEELLGKIIEDISYNNAKEYFGIELD